MDSNLEINVDFLINNPELIVETEKAKATITGVNTSIEDLNRKLADARKVSASATDFAVLKQSNAKVQELESSISKMSNVGKTGFDAMGNAIQNNGNFLGKAVAMLYRVGNILPGIGVAGLLAFAIDPIVSYLSKLDMFKEKLTDVEKAAVSMQKSLEGGGEYAKAVTAITSLRVNLDLVKNGLYLQTKVVEDYNKSIGAVAGQVKTLDEVEKGLAANAENYVKMTLYKAAAEQVLQEAGKKAADAAKRRNADVYEDLGVLESTAKWVSDKTKGSKFFAQGQIDYSIRAKERKEAAAKAIEEEAKPLETIANTFLKKAADFSQKMGGMLGLDKSAKVKTTGADKAVDAAESLQRRVLEITEEYSRKSKTKDEEELQALRDKFAKVADEVLKFNRNPKHKIKVDGSALETVRESAITDLKYRQDTEKLKVNLEEQKRLYSEYEAYKKDFGEERAKERFAKELDLNKTFTQSLESQLAELNGKATLTGAETERKKALEKLLADARLQELKQNDENFKSALETAKTYSDKLLEIEKDFQKKKASLQTNKSDSPERIAELERQKAQAIEAAKDEALQKTAIYKQLAVDTLEMTRSQVQAQIKIIDEILKQQDVPSEIRDKLYAELSRLKVVLNIGVDEANLQALQERYRALIAELSMKDSEGKSIISESERKRILTAIAEIRSKIKGIDVNADGKATWADKLAKNFEYLKGSTEEVAKGLQKDLSQIGNAFSTLSNDVGQYNTELASTLKTISQFANIGSSAASSVASFATGDIIGGVSSAISAIGGIVSYVSNLDFQYDQFYKNIIEGERKYQEALLARQLIEAKDIPIKYKSIASEYSLLTDSLKAYNKEYAKLFRDLQEQTYVDYVEKEKAIFITIATHEMMASLRGKTFEEMKQLLSEDRLRGKTKEMVERLVELEQKGYDAQKALNELSKQLAELFTGTTADTLTNSLVQLFEQGKTSVQDFADFFEKAMNDAALSIFKNKILSEAMNTFYDQFSASVMDGGLSKDEISSLNTLFSSLMTNATQEFDMLKQATGLSSLGTSSSSAGSASAVGTIARSITEQTGSELVGLGRSMYDTTKRGVFIQENSLSVLRESLLVQYAIQANTANTVTELKSAVTELKAINSNTKPNSSAYDRGF